MRQRSVRSGIACAPRARGTRRAVHRLVALGLAAAVVGLAPSTAVSHAQSRSSDEVADELGDVDQRAGELEGELGELRSELVDAQEELAAIGARLVDARGRLQAAEGQVALGEAALDEAEADQLAAEATYRTSRDELEETEAELAAEEAVLTEQIVQSFKYGTVGAQRGAMIFEVLRRAEDPNAFSVGMEQLRVVVDAQDEVVGDVFALRDRRSDLADQAARDRAAATQAAADAAETLRTLEELRAEAEDLTEEVAAEEDAQRGLITSLEASEDEVAALLSRTAERRDELARDLAEARAAEEAARRAAAAREAENGQAENGSGRLSTPGAGGGPALNVVCPVRGAVAGRDFSNDWGYPRSGGRYHRGNDIFAAHGTPVVAVAAGEVVRFNPPSAQTGLGGITVSYRTHDGSRWYNAHLSGLAAGIRPGAALVQGQVVGYVGNTGNAFSTPPHLHLGRNVGGRAVNPWPTIASACG